MKLDQSRYEEFWRNPERYRLIYELNIVPTVPNYSLARGIAFHVIANLEVEGRTEQEIDLVLTGQVSDNTGRTLSLQPKAIATAKVLWNYYKSNCPYANLPVLASESEFEFALYDSPHKGVGRLDRLIRVNGELWLHEFKTTNPKKKYDQAVDEWAQKKQADFEILGARALGYDPFGLIVSYVIEASPPRLMEPVIVKRTEDKLNASIVQIHETCEIIELLKRTVGIHTPWVHLFNYPCNRLDACEYQGICCRAGEIAMPEGFKKREEHLELLRSGQ